MDCSLFTAFNRKTAADVLVKKVKNKLNWNEVLCHKQLQLISKIKSFSKLTEILRHKGHLFFIFEKPYGNSLSITSPVERLQLPEVIHLMADLLQGIKELSEQVPGVVILPQWIYFHRNNLKVLHYQPFLHQPQSEQKYTFTHN